MTTAEKDDAGQSEDLEEAAAIFAAVRPRLFGIAYRMLGSSTEAEDLIQEVWLRWQLCDRGTVINPAAYLATATTRLSINANQSARVRRETYIGPWLPEPVATDGDPHLGAEQGEALGFAVLLLLERLSPTERAAYVLREAFDYPYRQIAVILGSTEVADPAETFAWSLRAARAAENEFAFAEAGHWYSVALSLWNGQGAVVLSRDDEVFAVITVDGSAAGIDQVLWMMNPAKFTAVTAAR